jgi:predicted amidohydrolase
MKKKVAQLQLQPQKFEFTEENAKKAEEILRKCFKYN